MTLFLQLVTTAALIPFAMIAVQASRLGIIGSVVGICVATAFGVAQFVGHYKWGDALLANLTDGWRTVVIVIAYYVSILCVGTLCAVLTLYIARFAAGHAVMR